MRRRTSQRWGAHARRGQIEPMEKRVLLSVVYVDDTAAGPGHDGGSWATAYTNLQEALDAAAATATPDEIRVAAGTYRPTARVDPADPRSATFRLSSGVSLLGGFSDGGGADPQRDPASNVTTLSGDIGTRGSAADNTYHVLLAVGVNGTAVLDGFTVTGGNADRSDQTDGRGAGMYTLTASPTVANCTFTGNSAWIGGGMYGFGATSPTVTRCTFSSNPAYQGGGMAVLYGASPTVADSTFTGNSAPRGLGGGMFTGGSSPSLTRCSFTGNSAANGSGGGIHNINTFLFVTDSTFGGNSAGQGGGIYNDNSSSTVTGSTFDSNAATGGDGGGIQNVNSSSGRRNGCTFSGNSAPNGHGAAGSGGVAGERAARDLGG